MPNHSRDPVQVSPGVSVVVLNWNGGDLVLRCLSSVMAQDLPAAEVLVVDNDSSDGSTDRIRPANGVRVLELGSNRGFSGGMNAGIDATSGEFVLLLNFDVELAPDYIRRCAAALGADLTVGGVTGKLLRPGNADPPILDSTGHLVFRSRRAVDRGEGEPDTGQYDSQKEVFGICGAAPMLRRTMLNEIKMGTEYFDEDFFAYFEDFDLAWRARLLGWSFCFVPEAAGWHHRGASGGKSSTHVLALNHVNRLFVMVKNDHPASFLRHLPGIAYTELRATFHMLGRRPAALLRAWRMFFAGLGRNMRKRRSIQERRKIGWRDLEHWFEPYRYGVGATVARARRRRSVDAGRLAR